MLNPCASFVVFLSLFRSAWGTGFAGLWMLLPLGWTMVGVPWSGSGERSPPSPPCLDTRGGRERVNLDGQTPMTFFEFSVAAGRQIPSLLGPAPARWAQAQTAWGSAAGSCQRGPGRDEMDPAVATQLASHPQPLSVSIGKLQARRHAIEMKRLAGARHPPEPGAGRSRAAAAGPGLCVLSLCLQGSNLHVRCHGLELCFTPGSAW